MYIWVGWWRAVMKPKRRDFLEPAHGVSGRLQVGLAPEGFRVDNYLHCRAWGGLQVSACLEISPLLAAHWSVTQPTYLLPMPTVRGSSQTSRGAAASGPCCVPLPQTPGVGSTSEVGWSNILSGRQSFTSLPQWGPALCKSNSITSHYPTSSHPHRERHLPFRAITEDKWNHSCMCIWDHCHLPSSHPFPHFQAEHS